MPSSDQKTVADLMVERLGAWGVKRLYGYAGDGNNPFLGALQRHETAPEFVQAKHEESAAFMAVAEAKYGRHVGVVTSTQGPGAVHLLNGLYDAKLDSAPVVAIVAQQHTTVLGSNYQQEIDLQHLFQDVASPFAQTVAAPEALPMVLDRAFRTALASAQPTVVVVPHDVQQAAAPELGQEHALIVTTPAWSTGRTLPRDVDLDAAAAVIEGGERIAILAGRGVRDARRELIAFAEHLGAGVAMSLLGKPYVDEGHALVAGTMGHLGTTAAARVLQSCDTLIIVGSNDPWTEFYPAPGQARAVQIDIDPAVLGNRYPIDAGIVSEAAPALEALRGRLRARPETPWRREVQGRVASWREVSRRRAEVEARPLNPELVARQIAERVSSDAQLAIDVGSSVYHYARQMRLPPTVEAHLSSTLASMGCGVAYGIGAKEVAPDRPVVVLAGDGAMQMLGINELITVASRWTSWPDPRFIVVVLHNRDLAEVSWEQREMEGNPRFEASQRIPRFAFAQYAELLGLRGMRVDDPAEIENTLDAAFATDRPVVVEAITDPDTPLLPPYPHVGEKLDTMRAALKAEGDAGVHALELLDAYMRIEAEQQ